MEWVWRALLWQSRVSPVPAPMVPASVCQRVIEVLNVGRGEHLKQPVLPIERRAEGRKDHPLFDGDLVDELDRLPVLMVNVHLPVVGLADVQQLHDLAEELIRCEGLRVRSEDNRNAHGHLLRFEHFQVLIDDLIISAPAGPRCTIYRCRGELSHTSTI